MKEINFLDLKIRELEQKKQFEESNSSQSTIQEIIYNSKMTNNRIIK